MQLNYTVKSSPPRPWSNKALWEETVHETRAQGQVSMIANVAFCLQLNFPLDEVS